MKTPKIILAAIIAFSMVGAFLAFKVAGNTSPQTTAYYFTLSTTAPFADEQTSQEVLPEPLEKPFSVTALINSDGNIVEDATILPNSPFITVSLTKARRASWENPNNWVRIFVPETCIGSEVLCQITIYDPALLNAAGKPKVDVDPLHGAIVIGLGMHLNVRWTDHYFIELKD